MTIKQLLIAGIPMLCLTSKQSLAFTTSSDLSVKSSIGSAFFFQAQKILITGTVVDENSQPVPGVGIKSLKTNKSAVTNAAGKFSIEVESATEQLSFTYIGYAPQTRAAGSGATPLNIKLVPAAGVDLADVVVIGYGTSRKSDLTGSVGSVREGELQERPASSLNQALAGRISGVQVNTNSGRPGGRANVRVRGFSSINSSNNPLYVVDGVQLPMSNQAQASQAIDYINPNDIVSVEVLKDASSTAIYGSRGANGVILITTKRGKTGESRIDYNADFSVPTVGPNFPKVLNAKEFLAVEDLAYKNMEKYDPAGWASGKYAGRNPALARKDPRLFDANGNPYYDTDWLKEATQNKLSQNHELGFSGGNDRTVYSFSIGHRNDQGLIKTSYLKRYSGRFSIDDQLKKWLKVGGTLSYTNQDENLVDQSDQVARSIVEDFPFLPVKYPDNGLYADNRDYPNAEGRFNVVHRLNDTKFRLGTQTTLGSLYSNITFTEGLEMKTIIGANIILQENNEYSGRTLNISDQGYAASRMRKEAFWSIENFLTYNKKLNENHSINALLGLSWQKTGFNSSSAEVRGFATDYYEYNNLGAGSLNPQVGSNRSFQQINSFFGRANYIFKDRYLFTVTARADGASKFGEDKKYSLFPSAAVAWRVSEENFLKDNNTISNLKLRTSIGVAGNSEIPPYSSKGLLGAIYPAVLGDVRVVGTGLNRLENKVLHWEKTTQSDIGLELGLFDGKINLEVDAYYRKTTEMLLDAPVPRTSGYATIRKNVGSMENKGVEVELNTTNFNSENFSWKTSFNISLNKNKVLTLASPADIFGIGGPNFTNPTNIIRVGEAAGSFWGLTRLGVWTEAERAEAAKFVSYRNGLTMLPGDIKYLDVNGDYAINDADRSIIGNGSPDAWGAFSNTFRYKKVDLTVELQYSVGAEVMDMTTHSSEDRQSLANSYATVLDAWTPQNQNSQIAEIRDTRAGYVTNVDTHWIKDASFIRGRNVLLGYTFGDEIVKKMRLNKLRLYVSAQNLFLITSKELQGDPETTPTGGYANDANNVFSQGMNWHSYPRPTIFMLGLNIGL